jgi:CubicO group peptidase (beta-lactamase class C family)
MPDAAIISRPEDVGLSAQRLAHIDVWRDKLVSDGKLAGVMTLVARRGQVAHWGVGGFADKEREKPMVPDTIFRIYSMTKPITSVALMMLYEEGRFQLDDPISKFLPAFANPRVAAIEGGVVADTVRAVREIAFRDLLSHTSGLTYGNTQSSPVEAMYHDAGVGGFVDHPDADLMDTTEKLAKLPLRSHPGAEWNYSVSTDVCAALVQAISGQRFGAFLQQRILGPLGMKDTSFFMPAEKRDRLAAIYARNPNGGVVLTKELGNCLQGTMESGGGGLLSTVSDYLTFCNMLLNKGASAGGQILGRKTVELMTTNHLRGDMADMGQPRFSESSYYGIGFGLGFSIMLDPAKAQILGTPGEFAWGGAASTAFWVDPAEEMIVIMMTQLLPSSTYPIRRELRVLSYQAVID